MNRSSLSLFFCKQVAISVCSTKQGIFNELFDGDDDDELNKYVFSSREISYSTILETSVNLSFYMCAQSKRKETEIRREIEN